MFKVQAGSQVPLEPQFHPAGQSEQASPDEAPEAPPVDGAEQAASTITDISMQIRIERIDILPPGQSAMA